MWVLGAMTGPSPFTSIVFVTADRDAAGDLSACGDEQAWAGRQKINVAKPIVAGQFILGLTAKVAPAGHDRVPIFRSKP
jgi:hypothetical protein